MPKNAAFNYGDGVFSRMMWLKVSSVYIATVAGYNVLFQDADLVWFQDPVPYLQQVYGSDTDIIFMDDGGRTPRFTPLYVNSGFYYLKQNERTRYLMEKMLKSVSEISTTHSHQATLIRHLVESHEIVGLEVKMVDQRLFPSGYMYHHAKEYIKNLKEYTELPYVFHMCWTDNRDQKVGILARQCSAIGLCCVSLCCVVLYCVVLYCVVSAGVCWMVPSPPVPLPLPLLLLPQIDYFKTIGMWYLPDKTNTYRQNVNPTLWKQNSNICAKASTMRTYLDTVKGKGHSTELLEKCCQPAPYFENKPKV